jgi:hypothetical protein
MWRGHCGGRIAAESGLAFDHADANFWGGGNTRRGGDRLSEEALLLDWCSLVSCLKQHLNFDCRLILKFERFWGSMLSTVRGRPTTLDILLKERALIARRVKSSGQSQIPTNQKAVDKLKRPI